MYKNKLKQAKDMIKKAGEDNREMKDALLELLNLEKQMAELAEMLLGDGKMQNEEEDFIGSEADNAMMVMARDQAKHDPELAALLKKLDESEKQIAGLTEMLGSA